MKNIKKTVSLLMVFVLLVPLFAGCGAHLDVSVYAKGFLSCIKKKDFKGAYERTYPYATQTLAEKDFIKKYQDIFDALKITGITISDEKAQENEKDSTIYTYTYTAKYISEKFGEFKNKFTMTLRADEDTLKVDWSPALIFPDMDFGDTVSVSTLKGERGEIFSSDNELLAKNDYAQTVAVDLTIAKKFEDFAQKLCDQLKLKKEDVKKKYDAAVKNKDDMLVVKSYPKENFDDADIVKLEKITGVLVDEKQYTPLRFYPLRDAAAHILGYTSAPDEKQAKVLKAAGYDPATNIGKDGLEKAYEEKLRATDGEAVYIRDERNVIKSTLYKKEPVNGCDLILSIDSGLQEKAYFMLASELKKGQKGAAIVMDPQTGAVQAAVSFPSYDNNLFEFPVSKEVYAEIQKNEALNPLITMGLYPPGSVIKPFTAAAALEANAIKPSDVFPYENEIVDNYWKPTNEAWSYPKIKRKTNAGSPLKLENAFIWSDNIYFAYLALLLGKDTLSDYFQKYTLGQPLDFDLPVAKSNIINENQDFNRKFVADMGYGQGQLLVTPLQMAAMFTTFANNGDMMKPMLVTALKREDGFQYDTVEEKKSGVLAKSVVKQSTLSTLLPLMEEVIEKGTGTGAKISGVRIAGKTGTAEIGGNKSREISWFAGFWMGSKEKRLVLVMVDVPEGEGSVKFTIAKELLQPDTVQNNTGNTNTGKP
jgi:penicillin-binding protein